MIIHFQVEHVHDTKLINFDVVWHTKQGLRCPDVAKRNDVQFPKIHLLSLDNCKAPSHIEQLSLLTVAIIYAQSQPMFTIWLPEA